MAVYGTDCGAGGGVAGALMKIGKSWFTQTPKVGEVLDTHEAEYHVTEIEPVGEETILRTKRAYEGDMFFRFGVDEVRRIALIGS